MVKSQKPRISSIYDSLNGPDLKTLIKPWFLDPDRTVRFDPINREPLVIPVLLALRTFLYEKCMKPLKPQSNCTVLRTVAGFRGSHGSIFLQYLAGKQISVHKEFEYKKTNYDREKENREPSW